MNIYRINIAIDKSSVNCETADRRFDVWMGSCTAGLLELSAGQFQGSHLVLLGAVPAGGVKSAHVDEGVVTGIIVVGTSELRHQFSIFVAHFLAEKACAFLRRVVPCIRVSGQVCG